jgi:hypothetical protein
MRMDKPVHFLLSKNVQANVDDDLLINDVGATESVFGAVATCMYVECRRAASVVCARPAIRCLYLDRYIMTPSSCEFDRHMVMLSSSCDFDRHNQTQKSQI